MPIRHCNYTKFYCKNQIHAVVELLHNDYGKGGEQDVNKLKKIPTEQLVGELLSRGCLKVNTEVRSPYQLGHKLVQTGYGHSTEIKAQTVLVVPLFSLE